MSRLHRLGPVSSLTDATFALPNDKLGLASGRSPGARTAVSRGGTKTVPHLSFCSLRTQTGSLRILAASTILLKDRVRPLSAASSQLQAKTLYRVRSLTSVHLSNHHCYSALPPFSSYHPLSWTIVPFLHTSLHNELVGDGRRWRRCRDQAVVTRRGSRQIG
jgi:hypothetical protein